MGIKKLLAQKYAGFISLDEVLGQMSKSSGVSYQEAATALHILLEDDAFDAPGWRVKHRLQGISVATIDQHESAATTLRHIAEFGYPDDAVPF
jgi:hypothetical protein